MERFVINNDTLGLYTSKGFDALGIPRERVEAFAKKVVQAQIKEWGDDAGEWNTECLDCGMMGHDVAVIVDRFGSLFEVRFLTVEEFHHPRSTRFTAWNEVPVPQALRDAKDNMTPEDFLRRLRAQRNRTTLTVTIPTRNMFGACRVNGTEAAFMIDVEANTFTFRYAREPWDTRRILQATPAESGMTCFTCACADDQSKIIARDGAETDSVVTDKRASHSADDNAAVQPESSVNQDQQRQRRRVFESWHSLSDDEKRKCIADKTVDVEFLQAMQWLDDWELTPMKPIAGKIVHQVLVARMDQQSESYSPKSFARAFWHRLPDKDKQQLADCGFVDGEFLDAMRHLENWIERNLDAFIRFTELSDAPPIKVSGLMDLLEGAVSLGQPIPYMAYVSGPGINRKLEFKGYDAKRHQRVVADALMEQIRCGANRIVIVSEVWIAGEDEGIECDGVLIFESTPMRESGQVARFEGKTRLGGWGPVPADESANKPANLENLFDRAWKVPGERHPVIYPSSQNGVGSQRKETL